MRSTEKHPVPRRPALVAVSMALALGCGLSEFPQPGANVPGGNPPEAGAGGSAGGAGGSTVPAPTTGGRGGSDNGGNSGSGGTGTTGGRGGSTGGTGAGAGGAAGTGGATGAGGSGTDAGTADRMTVDAPPAPSGMQVSINGTLVPKEKVIVFLHIGHSNMAGRVTTPTDLRSFNFETHPRLWAYAKGGVWRAAKEPLSGDSMNGSCGGVGCAGLPAGAGPGMSILRTALAAAPDAYVVSIGRGQSGLTAGYCRSFRKGGLLYDYVMGPAMELKGKVTFGGIWTMFGQSEINDTANISRFGDCMVGVATDMRNDLGEPDLPFVVGDWEENARGSLTTTSSTGRAVIPQMRMLPMRIPRSVLIPTDGLPMNPLDGQHYDLTGYKQWAERGFGLLKMNGLAPWMSAP